MAQRMDETTSAGKVSALCPFFSCLFQEKKRIKKRSAVGDRPAFFSLLYATTLDPLLRVADRARDCAVSAPDQWLSNGKKRCGMCPRRAGACAPVFGPAQNFFFLLCFHCSIFFGKEFSFVPTFQKRRRCRPMRLARKKRPMCLAPRRVALAGPCCADACLFSKEKKKEREPATSQRKKRQRRTVQKCE